MLTSGVVLKITCCVAELQSDGIFCLYCCVQGLCGSNIVIKSMWSSSQSVMGKGGVSSATAADDIDDGYVQDTKFLSLMKSMMIKIRKVVIMKEIRMVFT